ncbi:hypothetical protein [Pontibacter liquoris]|uniref:hypothetical protein n=1 Tax=Pontibacter liquoris TaxID=2905677 RepID=UPI001FA7BA67|nr:hypothetical protein [Pontibacter liquoris]
MGKRQIRIFRKDIVNRASELLLQPAVQVVLRSRVVLHGVLEKLNQEQLQLQDQRFGRHVVSVAEIEEIIYDLEAPW